MKPKIEILQPYSQISMFPFYDQKDQPAPLLVCLIQAFINNDRGRASAKDVNVGLSLQKSGSKLTPNLYPSGFVDVNGGRKLRQFFFTSHRQRFGTEEADLYLLADIMHDQALRDHETLSKGGGGRNAFIGFGVKGFKHAYIAGQVCKFPLKEDMLTVSTSDDEYGGLRTRVFHIIYRKWDNPTFKLLV